MGRLVCAFIFVATIFLSINTSVFATSWIEMEPKEVSDDAEVVVSGTYDFSSETVPSDFVFVGYTFNVENVYRGETSGKIIVGIDLFDVGWADKFQKEGGKFLLFLETSDSATFQTPVGGPNGMIQLFDGDVQHRNSKNQIFYEEILNSTFKKPSGESDIAPIDNEDSSSAMLLWIGGVAIIVLLGAILLLKYRRRGNR